MSGNMASRFATRPAIGLREVAERIGISHVAARQILMRTRNKLPPTALSLIDEPREYARRNLERVGTTGVRPAADDPAGRFLTELERLIGTRSPDDASLERAARVVAAEESWRDGLGVLLDIDDVARLLHANRERVAQLAADGEMIVLESSDRVVAFPAFQFQDGQPTPALARAHRTLVESGYVSPESAASWARTSHPELELRSPAQWAGEHRDDARLLLVARRDAARAAQ